MKIDILTLFPEMFMGPFDTSMLKKARDNKFVNINIHNLRDWATDKHKTVDDRPFGGGPGMIIRVDVVDRAISNISAYAEASVDKQFPISNKKQRRTVLLSAKGKRYDQKKALELSKLKHLILIAGHYEGVDERVAENLVDEEISIGDYVLTGGEIPIMVIVDSTVRLIPGVLKPESLINESFSPSTSSKGRSASGRNYRLPSTNVEYPQYTRPVNYKGWNVPEILLSGNHKEIENFRRKRVLEETRKNR